MATKYAHADVLDGGLNVVKNSATKMLLISSYAALDSYATVVSRKLAEVTMASGDYAITGADGAARVLTTAAGKTAAATAAASSTPDLHFVFTDGASKVYWVTHETSNPATVSISDTINFPQLTLTSGQPT